MKTLLSIVTILLMSSVLFAADKTKLEQLSDYGDELRGLRKSCIEAADIDIKITRNSGDGSQRIQACYPLQSLATISKAQSLMAEVCPSSKGIAYFSKLVSAQNVKTEELTLAIVYISACEK